jgi:hypothetical protein
MNYAPRRRAKRLLRFGPLAYLKLQFLCHAGPTEVGAFGISAESDLLYVEDVVAVRQECTAVSVYFQDEAVADHFERCAANEIPPQRCGRIWLHTHPGGSAAPSSTDEETIARAFGGCDWAVMAILSRTGRSYARLQVSGGPGAARRLRWAVDWAALPQGLASSGLGLLEERWAQEYAENVTRAVPLPSTVGGSTRPWPGFREAARVTGLRTDPHVDPVLEDLDDWYAGAFSFPDQPHFDPYGGEHAHELP